MNVYVGRVLHIYLYSKAKLCPVSICKSRVHQVICPNMVILTIILFAGGGAGAAKDGCG